MSNLFVVMLGGRHVRANTEVHDVVFAIGSSLDEITPQLKQAWFGELKGLHIDAWMKVRGIESGDVCYQVHLSHAAPSTHEQKLYLINLGGYDAREFGELHRYVLVVAPDSTIAKQRGKAYIDKKWQKAHTDRIIDVDDCLAIDCIHGRYIHLVEGNFAANEWENTYITLA
ncbi:MULTISPECIES: DUF1543 domain-containing protein [unclassified Acinetobacter]|uniref:DUF1543 domain-containing protein n=1 Tax=unclassified Acinetobacter TaxID=196816 RepID=UPI00190C540E|nr:MULTISPECIES: DUF1543 domain-containing protein [unclassified Acinetobacter]MBK0062650.1 DUF1543 domain-containing protein [Acinetobacter sp. S55]MBK0065773.1 DUF1543 domain-containing protein [Acinetobacter sp. S54]